MMTIQTNYDDIWNSIKNEFTDSKSNMMNSQEEVCERCGNNGFDQVDGMYVCNRCGLMSSSIIDYKQEWRNFDDKDNSRCGSYINQLMPETSLGTYMMGKGCEHLKKINNWGCINYRERVLMKIFRKLHELADANHIPICVIERAKVMYKILCNDNIKRGKSLSGLIGACIYNSCKDKYIPMSMVEIAQIFNLKVERITKGCKQFDELMLSNNMDYMKTIDPINEKMYIDKYCSKLNISDSNKLIINYAANISNKLGIMIEAMPESIAICTILLINDQYNLNIDKEKLLMTKGVSKTTISKLSNKLIKYKKFILPLGSSNLSLGCSK